MFERLLILVAPFDVIKALNEQFSLVTIPLTKLAKHFLQFEPRVFLK